MTGDLVKGIRDQVAGATYQGRVAVLHREDEYHVKQLFVWMFIARQWIYKSHMWHIFTWGTIQIHLYFYRIKIFFNVLSWDKNKIINWHINSCNTQLV